jgi:hypothetical protein
VRCRCVRVRQFAFVQLKLSVPLSARLLVPVRGPVKLQHFLFISDVRWSDVVVQVTCFYNFIFWAFSSALSDLPASLLIQLGKFPNSDNFTAV